MIPGLGNMKIMFYKQNTHFLKLKTKRCVFQLIRIICRKKWDKLTQMNMTDRIAATYHLQLDSDHFLATDKVLFLLPSLSASLSVIYMYICVYVLHIILSYI